MTKLGRRVDPLEFDLLECSSARVCEHGFTQSHHSLLHTRAVTLQQQEVILDFTVADKATHAASD